MEKTVSIKRLLVFLCFFLFVSIVEAQNDSITNNQSKFWKKVKFGGGIGLNVGNGFTNIGISPMLYYPVNKKIMVGGGLTTSYIKNQNLYNSWMYGGSAIVTGSPIDYIQLSSEIEQLRVNVSYPNSNLSSNFWNTALFLGAGYQTNNFVFGARYNVLHNSNNNIYTNAWMPFFRVIF